MKITWLGTAAIRLEADGETILFDPFVQLVGGENPNCLEDFLQDQTIFVTHGHLDHLMEVPEFLDQENDAEATVYCGEVAADTLSELVEDTSNVVKVKPGDVLRLGKVQVLVLEGKHAKPGKSQVVQKLFSRRFVQFFKNALALAYLNPKFPEGGQTLMYEVHAEGKRVQVMGSLGLQEDQEYPTGADLLILPFQGSEFLEAEALDVVARLQPKRILLDHFDDAFPPVSEHVDTRRFKKLMDEDYPQIRVVKPTAGKTVEL